MRHKFWLASELTIAICFYYVTYSVILVILGKAEPWLETGIEFQTFCATSVFLYATVTLVNFVMSLIKGRTNAFRDCFTDDWFSVHKLLGRAAWRHQK